MFNKILIANRGEIACRIIKTAKKLGIQTVAVYSSADKHALFVQQADEAFLLGPPPAAESYLKQEKIIEIAQKTKAQAIHPGYGFLSENADFAKACADAGIVFIGPSANAIQSMGDKSQAKKMMQKAGVPIAPSFDGDTTDATKLNAAAKKIGLPLLVKAAFGGGGRGMRLVNSLDELANAVQSAEREAEKSFSNGTVFLEKYVQPARHVEVQIFADSHGNTVHLFDRDCSIQRRHQKVIEEAPAPNLKTKTREAMYQAAINAAKAIQYTGAGTVEFLVDCNENFYFMEMNTRLQVEHPVTEMITGIDLVEWQLKVAAGEPLPLKQEQIHCQGHAIEARICAESPENDFRPSSGKLLYFHTPNEARVDTGFSTNSSVSPFYDSMIAKVICHATDRKSAINKLMTALKQFYIVGVDSNVAFLIKLLSQNAFQKEKLETTFIDKHPDLLVEPKDIPPAVFELAANAHHDYFSQSAFNEKQSNDRHSPWLLRDHWRMVSAPKEVVFYVEDEPTRHCEKPTSLATRQSIHQSKNHATYFNQNQWHIFHEGKHYILPLEKASALHADHTTEENALIAQMPATVSAVYVKSGQAVKEGEKLMVLEAMKMEHVIHAPHDGEIKTVHFKAGDSLNEGVQLLEFV